MKEICLIVNPQAGSFDEKSKFVNASGQSPVQKILSVDNPKLHEGLEEFAQTAGEKDLVIAEAGGDGTVFTIAAQVQHLISEKKLPPEIILIPLPLGNQNVAARSLGWSNGKPLHMLLQEIRENDIPTLRVIPRRISGEDLSAYNGILKSPGIYQNQPVYWLFDGILAVETLKKLESVRNSGRSNNGKNLSSAVSALIKLAGNEKKVGFTVDGKTESARDVTFVSENFPWFTTHFFLGDRSTGRLIIINQGNEKDNPQLLTGLILDALWAKLFNNRPFKSISGSIEIRPVDHEEIAIFNDSSEIQVDSEIYIRGNSGPVVLYRRPAEEALNFGIRP